MALVSCDIRYHRVSSVSPLSRANTIAAANSGQEPRKILLQPDSEGTGAIFGAFFFFSTMGYGARLAFGCNIGAYFGGIASFSLHGYIWGILAMAGTFLALYLRPLFGLSVPKSSDSVC